jgi:hypothetical protein
MKRLIPIAAAGTAILLGGCEMKLPEEDGNAAAGANVQASAEGKAEDGKISIKAPGFDLAISIPKEVARGTRADGDNKILYPGVAISGMHIAAGEGGGEGNSEVEMRFTSSDAPQRLADWYRDPARADGFALSRASGEGRGFVIDGVQKADKHPFTVYLAPREAGGTDGRLVVRHRD